MPFSFLIQIHFENNILLFTNHISHFTYHISHFTFHHHESNSTPIFKYCKTTHFSCNASTIAKTQLCNKRINNNS